MYIYEESFVISYSSNLTFYIHKNAIIILLVETGQHLGAGLTQVDKT